MLGLQNRCARGVGVVGNGSRSVELNFWIAPKCGQWLWG